MFHDALNNKETSSTFIAPLSQNVGVNLMLKGGKIIEFTRQGTYYKIRSVDYDLSKVTKWAACKNPKCEIFSWYDMKSNTERHFRTLFFIPEV